MRVTAGSRASTRRPQSAQTAPVAPARCFAMGARFGDCRSHQAVASRLCWRTASPHARSAATSVTTCPSPLPCASHRSAQSFLRLPAALVANISGSSRCQLATTRIMKLSARMVLVSARSRVAAARVFMALSQASAHSAISRRERIRGRTHALSIALRRLNGGQRSHVLAHVCLARTSASTLLYRAEIVPGIVARRAASGSGRAGDMPRRPSVDLSIP